MNLFDADPPNSSEPPDRPNWEERLASDLRRVCPDYSGPQRQTVIRILRTWGRWLSPGEPDPWTTAAGICFLPAWFLQRCPFMSGERTRRCLRFFEGLWSARKLGFNETLAALSDLRRELDVLRHGPSSRPAALQPRRAAA